MNMPTHRDDPDIPADEWQAQERALRAERLGLADLDGDERMRDYRQVARVLRKPLADPLPADFAERVARRVRTRPPAREAFERLAGPLLMLVLIASGIGYAIVSASAWWPDLSATIPPRVVTNPWLTSLAACACLTAVLGMLPTPRRTHR
jgi:hypothetical protein